jgi:hypothetical protein
MLILVTHELWMKAVQMEYTEVTILHLVMYADIMILGFINERFIEYGIFIKIHMLKNIL